jgi:uncharacterized protein YidB (DUF937 family)
MLALLGLLAVAGYQNRDKIQEALGRLGGGGGGGMPGQPAGGAGAGGARGGQGGILGQLGGLFGGASAGSVVSGGLGQLVDRLRQSGHGETADSWVRDGSGQPIQQNQLVQAVGPEVLDTLSQHTGLSRDELLARLTRDLPHAVDKFTPDGRLPTEDEAKRLI